jgi:hypothetical protein
VRLLLLPEVRTLPLQVLLQPLLLLPSLLQPEVRSLMPTLQDSGTADMRVQPLLKHSLPLPEVRLPPPLRLPRTSEVRPTLPAPQPPPLVPEVPAKQVAMVQHLARGSVQGLLRACRCSVEGLRSLRACSTTKGSPHVREAADSRNSRRGGGPSAATSRV